MLKVILIALGLATIVTVAMLGVRGVKTTHRPWQIWNDMDDQAKYKPQESNDFFADGRNNRPIPQGAVAWGADSTRVDATRALRAEDFFEVEKIPVPVDRMMLVRGQQLFNVYCAVCHDQTGGGKGITTQYGMISPPSYHQDRLREVPDGYLFQVITEGKGLMGSYHDKIKLQDRWAVVAYVRALQRAAHALPSDLPASASAEVGQ